jgi:integrase
MRKTSLSLSKARIGGKLFWQVTVPKLGGGRERRTFKERTDAQTFLDLSKVQQQNYGTAALSITEELRVQAVECDRELSPFGKTLRDATKFYLAHLRAVSSSRKVSDVIAELIAARTADGASVRYLGDLRARLARFGATFGDHMIASVSAKQIGDWLRALNLAPLTRNTFRLRIAALYSFARRSGYVSESPLADVEKAKERAGEIEILTVEETARLLESATAETLPYWAIGAFAGLRAAEIARLDWSEIDFERGLIEIKASKAKTASRRHVHIQPNLAQWLAPYRNARGRVCPMGLRKKLESDRERAGMRQNWPQNALRHSFGSYHLARFPDAAALALQMGNSPQMIFKHYRELVKPAVAERYWSIAPLDDVRSKVVEMVA